MPSAISRKKLIRKFRDLGYTGPFSGGKHQFMKKGKQKIRIPNPHGSQEISLDLAYVAEAPLCNFKFRVG